MPAHNERKTLKQVDRPSYEFVVLQAQREQYNKNSMAGTLLCKHTRVLVDARVLHTSRDCAQQDRVVDVQCAGAQGRHVRVACVDQAWLGHTHLGDKL